MVSERAARAAVATSMVAPVAWLFGRVLWGDQALFWRDVLFHYWPLKTAVARSLAAGELPLWDAGVLGGVPLLANIHAAVLYPPNLLFQALSFPSAYGALMALHLAGLATGTYLLLRHWVSRTAAVGGALTFALSGSTLSLVDYGPNLMAHCWIPWALWALANEKARLARRVVGFAVAVAAQVLAGDPMSVIFTVLAALCLWPALSERRQAAVCLVGGGGLAVLLTAVQLLPAFSLLRQSTRVAPGPGQALDWALHPARLLELVLPQPYGSVNGAHEFWASFVSLGPLPEPYSASVYLGTAALVVIGLGVRRGPLVAVGLALVGVGLFFSLGGQLFAGPLLLHVPPFSLFRYPEKYVVLVALGAAFLVAWSLEALGQGPTRSRLLGVLGLGVSLGLLGLAVRTLGVGFLPWPASVDLKLAQSSLFDALGWAAAVALAVGAVAAALRRRTDGSLAGALVAVLVIDLLALNQACLCWGPVELYAQRPQLVDAMWENAPLKPFRFWRDHPALNRSSPLAHSPEQRVQVSGLRLATLQSRVGDVYGLAEVSGVAVAVLERWEKVSQALYVDGRSTHDGIFNACFVVAARGKPSTHLEGLEPVVQLPFATLLKHAQCVPRLHGVGTVIGVSSLSAALDELQRPGFDPARAAVVEGFASTDPLGALTVSDDRYRPGRVEATVSVEGPKGFLVVSESWADGWRAQVDGVAAALRPVDGAILGLPLSGGTHRVTLAYTEPWLWPGGCVSVLAALGALALAVMRHRD